MYGGEWSVTKELVFFVETAPVHYIKRFANHP